MGVVNSQGCNSYYRMMARRQQGVTLVELLVALVLGVVLVSAMTRVYLDSKKTYIQEEELSRLQESSRFVLHILKREFRMAGFFGGSSTPPAAGTVLINHDCEKGWALNAQHTIDFFDDSANIKYSAVRSSVQGDAFSGCIKKPAFIQPGTDIISIKRSAGIATLHNAIYASTGKAAGEMKPDSFYLKLAGINPPELLYVGSRFPRSVLVPFANPVLQTSMWRYMAKVFYVRNYSIVPGDNIPVLMMVALENKKMVETALIEGVEGFHIEFGIPSATSQATPVRFVANPDSQQLAAATVLRLYLLMRTRNEIRNYTDSKSYRLGTMPVMTPGGHFMRRVVSTTIKLRNR